MKQTHSHGFSLVELLLVVAVILIIAAIAIPSLMHSKMAANESSAVGSLRSINTASVNYAGEYGIGYPADITNLAPSASPSSASADLLDAVLATGTKSGYTFTYAAGAVSSSGAVNTYTIVAVPVSPGVTGTRGFYTDQTFVIRADPTGSATSSSTPIS